jgi:uncharacterized membrane protein YidH (DUF202 family)
MNEEAEKKENISIIINEVQLILAEKRTSLAVMRTGIAVLAFPISVLSVLIATSRFYDASKVLHLLIPLGILLALLIAVGIYLIVRSMFRMRHFDQLIRAIKVKHSILAEFMD